MLPGNLPPYIVGVARSVSNIRAAVATTLVAGQTVTFTFYRSTNNGVTYNAIAAVTIPAGGRANSASFAAVALNSGDLLLMGAAAAGSNYTNSGFTGALY